MGQRYRRGSGTAGSFCPAPVRDRTNGPVRKARRPLDELTATVGSAHHVLPRAGGTGIRVRSREGLSW